jgi:hypothetical protein
MKFSPTQQQFLNVLIKVNTVKLATLEESLSKKKYNQLMLRPISKLLVARLKDTGVLFSFFVTISMIAN